MATGHYIGVNGVARKITAPYIGVNGVARNVKSGYVGVDGVARRYFCLVNKAPAVLQVKKVVAETTYANSMEYTNEEFVLLSITPAKAGSTVNVTYGGLTKTLTFSTTNAQNVFFGTFNGVTDSVTTPTSGTLTIEGDYVGFGCGIYNDTKSHTTTHSCITEINEFGDIKIIPDNAFYKCVDIAIETIEIPEGVTSIGQEAFLGVYQPNTFIIPSTVTNIDYRAFNISLGGDNTFIVKATIPPILGELAFNAGVADFIVPKGYGDVYKGASGWSEYANRITEES